MLKVAIFIRSDQLIGDVVPQPRPFSLAPHIFAQFVPFSDFRMLCRPALLSLAIALAAPAHAATLPANNTAPQAVPQSGYTAQQIEKVLERIKLPKGFSIALYALVPQARHIAVGPQGKVIFVGTTSTKLYAITAGDNRAAKVETFAPSINLVMPNGPCFAPDGSLFIAEQNRILRFPNAEQDAASKSLQAEIVVPQGELIPRSEQGRGHSARVCRVGPDGKLYVSLGQPYNVTPPNKVALYQKLGIGGIIRMNLDGTEREVFATGIRNSVGMDFNPKDNVLWFTDNQVDMMGDDIPPGEINRAPHAGLNFGFPWYGGGHTRTRKFAKSQPPDGLVFPEIEEVAHAADLGIIFYRGSSFPEKYRGGIFSAQHGSWNRTNPVGARVMFSTLKPDGTGDKSQPFAEGWNIPNGGYLGRPVDVAETPDGSLLVSDDDAGALYRITYKTP
jgi:glucose/arabinose dehydrogenase